MPITQAEFDALFPQGISNLYNRNVNEKPETWAATAWAKAVKAGMDKRSPQALITREQMVVLFCKLGLVDYFVKLSQMKNSKVAWNFREVNGYNLTTSIPTYKNPNVGRDIIQDDVNEINRVLNKYEINTLNRVRHFLAQCHVESGQGYGPIERFNSNPITDFADRDFSKVLGNNAKGDGAKFRGAGAIQLTGRDAYKRFSRDMEDPKILSDGALYVGQKYFWEAAGYYWTKYKPYSTPDETYIEKYDLNKRCDENASVKTLTGIINGNENDRLTDRTNAYNYYKGAILF